MDVSAVFSRLATGRCGSRQVIILTAGGVDHPDLDVGSAARVDGEAPANGGFRSKTAASENKSKVRPC
jgi:hypothetical protein